MKIFLKLKYGLFLLSVGTSTCVWANPDSPEIKSGDVSFNQTKSTFTVFQESAKAIIDWEGFSIENGEVTEFIQPNTTSIVLNRVTGSTSSTIYGSLKANGSIYLINENGILVGPGGQVQTGGFLASTLNLSNHSFLRGGNLGFGSSSSKHVINEGTIQVVGGDILLFSKQVHNSGKIEALDGEVVLAGSAEVFLGEKDNRQIRVRPKDNGQVYNSGTIDAIAVEIKAGGSLYTLAINQSGIVEAKGFNQREGKIVLCAEIGNSEVSGTLSATSQNETSKNRGGIIHLLSEGELTIHPDTKVEASGKKGGGEILVGGNYLGKDPNILNVKKVRVKSHAQIQANALDKGDGGKVIIWGDKENDFRGNIEAIGGPNGGHGGFVEISSPAYLFHGGKATAHATDGNPGTILFDPGNITIAASGSSSPALVDGVDYTPNQTSSTLYIGDIEASLNGGNNVIVKTNGTPDGNGTVTI